MLRSSLRFPLGNSNPFVESEIWPGHSDFMTLFARDWPAYFRADRMEAFCTRSAAALSATERRSVS